MLGDLFKTPEQDEAERRKLREAVSFAGYCDRTAREVEQAEAAKLHARIADLESVNRDQAARIVALEAERAHLAARVCELAAPAEWVDWPTEEGWWAVALAGGRVVPTRAIQSVDSGELDLWDGRMTWVPLRSDSARFARLRLPEPPKGGGE